MTRFEPNLRIPGPTALPPTVREAGGRQMVNHRGEEFKALTRRVEAGMKPFFGTEHDVILLTCAGTGGLEAAVVNVLSPGDPVLAVTMGAFGDRFAKIAEVYGAAVTRLEVEWGEAPEPADGPRGGERRSRACRAVLLTHNETCTGVTNDIPALAAAVREAAPDALILVDAISALGAVPFAMDAWGLDLVVTGSQKAWMSAPGMAFAAVGPRAWAAAETARMPRFYLDLRRHRDTQVNGETPWTPAVAVMYQVDEGLRLMEAEGEGVFARHAACAAMTRAGPARDRLRAARRRRRRQPDGHRRLDPGGARLEGLQRRAQAARPRPRRRPGQAQGADLPPRAPGLRHDGRHPRRDRRARGDRHRVRPGRRHRAPPSRPPSRRCSRRRGPDR